MNGAPDLPLRLVVFVVDDQRYALRLDAVEQVLAMVAVAPLPHAPRGTLGVINVHGTVMPVLDLRSHVGRPRRDYGLGGHLLVARTNRGTVALPVDEVVGLRDLSAVDVATSRAGVPGIDPGGGIATLADGVLYLHDLARFLSHGEPDARCTPAAEGRA